MQSIETTDLSTSDVIFTDPETLGMTTFERLIMIIKQNDYLDYINLDWVSLSSFSLSEQDKTLFQERRTSS